MDNIYCKIWPKGGDYTIFEPHLLEPNPNHTISSSRGHMIILYPFYIQK